MITVQDIFQLAIETDMTSLAHRTFWALSEGKVQAGEDFNILDRIDYDDVAISQLIEQNKLGIGRVKLFVAATQQPGIFIFYYSENLLDAHALHQKLFNETPKRLTHAPHLLGKVFELSERRDSEILYFHRRKVVSFPYCLGIARAGEQVLNRVEHTVT